MSDIGNDADGYGEVKDGQADVDRHGYRVVHVQRSARPFCISLHVLGLVHVGCFFRVRKHVVAGGDVLLFDELHQFILAINFASVAEMMWHYHPCDGARNPQYDRRDENGQPEVS